MVHLPPNFNIDSPDLSDRIYIKDTGTISLYVARGHFYFPLTAYELLGSNIGNTATVSPLYNKNTLLKNDYTFNDYLGSEGDGKDPYRKNYGFIDYTKNDKGELEWKIRANYIVA